VTCGMFLDDPVEAIFDVNLLIQVALIVCLVIGTVLKGVRKRHGVIMGIGTLANLAASLLVMVPALFRDWGGIVVSPLDPAALTEVAHAVLGTLAIAVALVFLARFLLELRAKKPLKCGTVWSMRIVLVLWLLSFGFGLMVYLAP
jgi:hypothetical protein